MKKHHATVPLLIGFIVGCVHLAEAQQRKAVSELAFLSQVLDRLRQQLVQPAIGVCAKDLRSIDSCSRETPATLAATLNNL